MKNVISFVVVVLSLCLGHAVRADEPYRLQMLGADALSIGLVVGGAYAESAPLVYSGFAVGAFGAPVVHFSNGHATRGLWSMGVRLLAPIAGIALGSVLGPGCGSSKSEACVLSGLGNAMVGWFAGYAAGLVTDYVFIASLDDKPAVAAKPSPSVNMAVLPKNGGALLSAVGSF